ncbi:MAG: hypothetical protein ABL908_18545, partial [Hyphomicrobium sp.]
IDSTQIEECFSNRVGACAGAATSRVGACAGAATEHPSRLCKEHSLGYNARQPRIWPTKEFFMPNMSDARRKRIQAKQRKATNALKRAAKAAKRARNKAS